MAELNSGSRLEAIKRCIKGNTEQDRAELRSGKTDGRHRSAFLTHVGVEERRRRHRGDLREPLIDGL